MQNQHKCRSLSLLVNYKFLFPAFRDILHPFVGCRRSEDPEVECLSVDVTVTDGKAKFEVCNGAQNFASSFHGLFHTYICQMVKLPSLLSECEQLSRDRVSSWFSDASLVPPLRIHFCSSSPSCLALKLMNGNFSHFKRNI